MTSNVIALEDVNTIFYETRKLLQSLTVSFEVVLENLSRLSRLSVLVIIGFTPIMMISSTDSSSGGLRVL